jgi:hypothetical protein
MPTSEDTLSSQQVIDLLGVNNLSYLYYLQRTGQLLPIEQQTLMKKPRLRYRRSDVEAFIEARKADKESSFRGRIAVA